jgi:chromate transporter
MRSETKPDVDERKPPEVNTVPLTQFVGYFLWLGTVGFGGPIALAGHRQQDLVELSRSPLSATWWRGLEGLRRQL